MISDVDVKALMNEYSKLGKPFLFGVDFEMERGFFIDEPLETDKVYWRIGDKGNFEKLKSLVSINKKEISLRRYPVCFEEYKDKIGQVIKAIKRGDSFLTNLTIKTPIETGCSFEEIFVKSNSVYSLLFPGKFV